MLKNPGAEMKMNVLEVPLTFKAKVAFSLKTIEPLVSFNPFLRLSNL